MDDMTFGTVHDSDGAGEAPKFATGNYIVTCVTVEDAGKSKFPKTNGSGEVITDDDGNPIYPERWKWVLRVDDVDAKRPTAEQSALIGQDVWWWTNKTLGPKSNTRAFIDALIGRPLTATERPKLGWVIGQQAIASLIVNKDGKLTNVTLLPYEAENAGQPLGAPSRAAALPPPATEDDREREDILVSLYEVDDRRDLAALRNRIEAAKLTDDAEVTDTYNAAYKRLRGEQDAPSSNRQAALVQ